MDVVLQVLGFASLVTGVWLMSVPAALIVAGVLLIFAGMVMEYS